MGLSQIGGNPKMLGLPLGFPMPITRNMHIPRLKRTRHPERRLKYIMTSLAIGFFDLFGGLGRGIPLDREGLSL